MVKILGYSSKPRSYTLKEIYDKRRDVLIRRNAGGLGDILMHRMLFEDFKLLVPDIKITFACPVIYHDAVLDHPFIDHVVDCKTVKDDDFLIHYNTTHICSRHELQLAPYVNIHRSDIWAKHCGLELTRHNMHFRVNKAILPSPNVLIAPISAMLGKNLEIRQCQPVIDELKKRGYHVFIIHNNPTPQFDAPCLNNLSMKQWLETIAGADYVISVDTAAYHCAGGMDKPVVAIFGWADGKVYSKYYPRVELVQRHREDDPEWTCGPCYNFVDCPKSKDKRKPCITSLTADMILEKFDKLVNTICHTSQPEPIMVRSPSI